MLPLHTARPPMCQHCASCLLNGGKREDCATSCCAALELRQIRSRGEHGRVGRIQSLVVVNVLGVTRGCEARRRRTRGLMLGRRCWQRSRLVLFFGSTCPRPSWNPTTRKRMSSSVLASEKPPAAEVRQQLDRRVTSPESGRDGLNSWGSVPMLGHRGCALAMGWLRPDLLSLSQGARGPTERVYRGQRSCAKLITDYSGPVDDVMLVIIRTGIRIITHSLQVMYVRGGVACFDSKQSLTC